MAEVRERLVNGIRVQEGMRSGGPRVVLLHGLGNSLEIWHLVTARLDSLVPWAAIDIPGFGKSHRLEDENLATVITALKDLFGEMEWRSPHVVGHSMGGLVAWGLAAERPELVGSLSLVSAPPLQALRIVERPCDAFRHPRVATNLVQQVVGASVPIPRTMRDRVLSSRPVRELLLSPYVANPSALDATDVAFALAETGGLGAARAILANSSLEFSRLASETNCPVRIIIGDRDRLMTSDDISWAVRYLQASVETIASCGHWPHLEHPVHVAELIAGGTHE